MPTVVACPSCAGKLRLPDGLRGRKVRCPACDTVFEPGPASAPPPTPDLTPRLTLDDPPGPPPAVPTGSGFGFVELGRSLDLPREPAPTPPPPRVDDTPRSRPPAPGTSGSPSRRRDEEDDLRKCPHCGRHLHRDSARCCHCGERLGGRPRIVYDDPERRDWEPERGGLVLTLGVLSLVCLAVCGPAGVALGITAWVLGHGDLRKMRARQMDPAGYGTTQGGYVCGIIGTALNALWTLGCVGFLGVAWYDAHRPPVCNQPPPIQWKDQGKW